MNDEHFRNLRPLIGGLMTKRCLAGKIWVLTVLPHDSCSIDFPSCFRFSIVLFLFNLQDVEHYPFS